MTRSMYIRNGALAIFSRDKMKTEKKTRRFKSLRLIWFIMLVLVGTVPVIVINRIVLATSAANEVQSRIARIQNQWLIVVNQVSKSGYIENPKK